MTRRQRVLHVIQARTGSRRLPGKVLAPIDGWPLLEYTVARARAAGGDAVLVATTTRPEDDRVALLAGRLGVHVLRGPEDDVLGRFALVARSYPEMHWLARWTADNPFADQHSPRRLLGALTAGHDYGVEVGLPVGAAVELISRTALLDADRDATTAEDREHVTLFTKREAVGRIVRLAAPDASRAPDLRLTVDTAADLELARRVAADLAQRGLDPRVAALPDVIASATVSDGEEVA